MAFTSGPLYLNVFDFGAVGDGVTDDSGAIQSAIDAAITIRSSGAQNAVVVSFPPAPYLCSGPLNMSIPAGSTYEDIPIVLSGSSHGPYLLDPTSLKGSNIPMFLITFTGGPFIQIGRSSQSFIQSNIVLEDLHFHYPENESPNSSPVLFPPTINIVSQNVRVSRCSTDNATSFVIAGLDAVTNQHVITGRLLFEDLYIGAFVTGISADTALDVVRCYNVHVRPFFDNSLGAIGGTTKYDLFARQNLVGFRFFRVDGAIVDGCSVQGGEVGLLAGDTDNASPPSGIKRSFGQVTNFSTKSCGDGFWIQTSQGSGWTFTNYVSMGAKSTIDGTVVESQWAGIAGNPNPNPPTVGFVQVVGGSVAGIFGQSQTLAPYLPVSSNSFSGPFLQTSGGSNMRAVWVDGYD